MTAVFTTHSHVEADVVRGLLDAHGVGLDMRVRGEDRRHSRTTPSVWMAGSRSPAPSIFIRIIVRSSC